MLDLQKDQGPRIVESVNEALEDQAVTAGQPTVAALKGPLDEKIAVIPRIQEKGIQAIANAQNLSILDNAGGSGFNGTNGNDRIDGTGEGPVQNKWLIKGVF